MPWSRSKKADQEKPPQAEPLPNRITSRGVRVLTTSYSQWYWREAESKVVRFEALFEGFIDAGEAAILFPDANTQAGATKIAAGRENRRLQAEQRARERRDAEAST
jgi:hypothetical protein